MSISKQIATTNNPPPPLIMHMGFGEIFLKKITWSKWKKKGKNVGYNPNFIKTE